MALFFVGFKFILSALSQSKSETTDEHNSLTIDAVGIVDKQDYCIAKLSGVHEQMRITSDLLGLLLSLVFKVSILC